MPASKIRRLSRHPFQVAEPILFDANVWLFLYPPPSGAFSLPAAYSAAFKSALQARARILLDVLVLSEYLNAYVRKEWKDSGLPNFKQFRNSADFRQHIGPYAADFGRRIVAQSELVSDHLKPPALEPALRAFSSGELDCNDALIAELCRANGWKLVTHDGDFRQAGIEVLTENPNLLGS